METGIELIHFWGKLNEDKFNKTNGNKKKRKVISLPSSPTFLFLCIWSLELLHAVCRGKVDGKFI